MSRTAGPIGCVVLAGGAGRRFGGIKQLAPLGGRPLLEYSLEAAAASPVDRTVVVLGAAAGQIGREIDFADAETVLCSGWAEGMAVTLKTGLDALGEVDAAVILLGDQPLIPAAAVARVLAARRSDAAAVRATYAGRPGHPVVIERALLPEVMKLRGDAGARGLLLDAVRVECGDIADPLDVDTPENLRTAEHALTA